jgi:hypothetical protein
MLTKLAALLQTKAGAAALAALLVTGSGAAAAATVTHGDLSKLGSTLQSALHGNDQNSNHGDESDCNSNGSQATDAPEATHAPEATERPEATDAPEATHAPEATEVPEATHTSGSGHEGEATHTSGSDHEGEATHTPSSGKSDGHEKGTACIAGTVTRVGTSSFVLTTTSGPVTVNVTADTKFTGGVKGLGDLKLGDGVRVDGSKQTDGSFTATKVNSQGAEQDGGKSEATKTP